MTVKIRRYYTGRYLVRGHYLESVLRPGSKLKLAGFSSGIERYENFWDLFDIRVVDPDNIEVTWLGTDYGIFNPIVGLFRPDWKGFISREVKSHDSIGNFYHYEEENMHYRFPLKRLIFPRVEIFWEPTLPPQSRK